MSESQAFIMNRTQMTSSVYTSISADWTWDEVSPAEYHDMKADTEALADEVGAEESNMLAKRGDYDGALDALHDKMQQIVGLARVKWRGDRTKKDVLKKLSGSGNSRKTKRAEIKKLLSAWPNLDAAWVPLDAYDLAAFTADRIAIEGNDTAVPKTKGFADLYDDANTDWRNKAEDLQDKLAADEKINVAWYSAATAVFPAGTANGDLIRGQVPTTYDPANEPLPLPGKPTQVIGERGPDPDDIQVIWIPVTYATSYLAKVTYSNSGGPQEATLTVTTNSVVFNYLPSGPTYTITITPSNATGPGPESDPINVT